MPLWYLLEIRLANGKKEVFGKHLIGDADGGDGGGCGDGDHHDEIDDNAPEIEPEMGRW